VNNIVITSSEKKDIVQLKQHLAQKLQKKDLEHLR